MYELQYHEEATRMIGFLNDLPVLLQGLAAISKLKLRFSGGVDGVWALGDEEERSKIIG